MNSKEKRKEKVKASLERVRDNPVLAHMRQVAYSPTSTQCIEEGDSLKTKLSSGQLLSIYLVLQFGIYMSHLSI